MDGWMDFTVNVWPKTDPTRLLALEFRVKAERHDTITTRWTRAGAAAACLVLRRHHQPEDEHEAALPKVSRNGKLYRKKRANLPFLKKHTWDIKQQASSSSTDDKAKTASMEKASSPPIFERTTQVSRTLFRYLAVLVLGTLLLSRAMTETWTFGYKGKWSNPMNWLPRPVSSVTPCPPVLPAKSHDLTQERPAFSKERTAKYNVSS
jgi:hypothetical protein